MILIYQNEINKIIHWLFQCHFDFINSKSMCIKRKCDVYVYTIAELLFKARTLALSKSFSLFHVNLS